MEAKAIAKYVRMSPIKVGAVTDLIEAAVVINKVLKSAVANAENNFALDTDKLYVSEIHVGQGPTLKRFRPMDHGKAFKILKKTSHITVVVKERA